MEIKRNISLDWMRLIACFLVTLQHVAEFYYVSPELKPNYTDNAVLVGIFNSISRISVPLFIMISGYLSGYMLLGYYLRRYYPFRAWQAFAAIVIGWIVTSWVFPYRLRHKQVTEVKIYLLKPILYNISLWFYV